MKQPAVPGRRISSDGPPPEPLAMLTQLKRLPSKPGRSPHPQHAVESPRLRRRFSAHQNASPSSRQRERMAR